METGLGPTAAAWGQLSSLGTPGSSGLDFSVRSSNSRLLDLNPHHWGPIVFSQNEASSNALCSRHWQRELLNSRIARVLSASDKRNVPIGACRGEGHPAAERIWRSMSGAK